MDLQLASELAAAQQAIKLPEVQEMMKRLAAYNLGVFMPHMHDETGTMKPLPDGTVQVEDDNLRATFQPADQVTNTSDRQYLTVGWRWSAKLNAMSGTTHCPMRRGPDGQLHHTGQTKTH